MIKDSGNRTTFDSGAVRDIQQGKGRCDLLPLVEVSHLLQYNELLHIAKFQGDGNVKHLYDILAGCSIFPDPYTMILEVAVHFEDGCIKYGERNWEKGIPAQRYIDSAVRHFLKYLRGDDDEPHNRAFIWNILCCIWTCRNKPELNTYNKGGDGT
jgi:hypothetical protein